METILRSLFFLFLFALSPANAQEDVTKVQEYSSETVPCHSCKGTGEVSSSCTDCFNDGFFVCVHCDLLGAFEQQKDSGEMTPKEWEERYADLKRRMNREQVERGVLKAGYVYCGLFCREGKLTNDKKCKICKGKGQHKCHSCDTTGKVVCWTCQGEVQVTLPCPDCAGDGNLSMKLLAQESALEHCPLCAGKKALACLHCDGGGTLKAKCIRCRGRGKSTCILCYGIGKRECISCLGAGKPLSGISEKKGVCDRCKGKGNLECNSCEGKKKGPCKACKGDGRALLKCRQCLGKKETSCAGCTSSAFLGWEKVSYSLAKGGFFELAVAHATRAVKSCEEEHHARRERFDIAHRVGELSKEDQARSDAIDADYRQNLTRLKLHLESVKAKAENTKSAEEPTQPDKQ